MRRKITFAAMVLLFVFTAACSTACSSPALHTFIEDIPEINPVIPAEETFIYQGTDYSITVNVETMLPFHFFTYSEGFFQVCFDGGNGHFDYMEGPHAFHDERCVNVGFIDTYGNVVIPLEHMLGEPFNNGIVLLRTMDFTHFFADTSGEHLFGRTFDSATGFNEHGFAVVHYGGGTGIINRDGEFIVPVSRFGIFSVQNPHGFFDVFEQNGEFRMGLIDSDGNLIIPIQYSFVSHRASEDLILVAVGHDARRRFGFYDTYGNIVIPATLDYSNVSDFNEGLAVVSIHDADGIRFGYIDRTGELVIPTIFSQANRFFDGLALVGIRGDGTWLYGFIDTEGNEVVPIKFADAWEFSEGRAVVSIRTEAGRRYGFVNREGDIAIPLEYEMAHPFNNGFAWVRNNGLWGMIDVSGNVVIPFEYANFSVVSDELIAVRAANGQRNAWGLVDTTGEIVADFVFNSIDMFSDDFALVSIDSRVGIINTRGEIVVPAMYNDIQRFDDFFVVREGNVRGIWQITPRQ